MDGAAVGFDEVFADCQSEATALYLRTRNTEVTVENTLVITRIDTFPKVLHKDLDGLIYLTGTNDDTSVLRCVVDGIR